MVGHAVDENSVFLNVLVAISSGMWAVKLCINKIIPFFTVGAG